MLIYHISFKMIYSFHTTILKLMIMLLMMTFFVMTTMIIHYTDISLGKKISAELSDFLLITLNKNLIVIIYLINQDRQKFNPSTNFELLDTDIVYDSLESFANQLKSSLGFNQPQTANRNTPTQ